MSQLYVPIICPISAPVEVGFYRLLGQPPPPSKKIVASIFVVAPT